MVFRYHLFRLFFWGVSSIIGIGLARTVLFPLIIALFSGASTFVIATTGATSRVVFGRFSQFLGNRDFIDVPTQEIFNSFELGLLFLTDKSNGATIMVGTSCTADAVYIILAVMWYIVVDYQTNIVNVYSSRNNIGSNQNILNSRIICSRWDCSKSECISPTFSFIRLNACVTSFTFNLEEAKIMTRSGV